MHNPITESDLRSARRVIAGYHRYRADGHRFAIDLAELIGCHVEEAWDILESYRSIEDCVRRCHVEIAPDADPEPAVEGLTPDAEPVVDGLTPHPIDWELWFFWVGLPAISVAVAYSCWKWLP